MPLAELEHAFINNLLKPGESEKDFLSQLKTEGNIDPEKQLEIYRSNLNGAAQKVLGQIYPACLNILGEDYFSQVCRFYRLQYPSRNIDLNQYGRNLPDFIKLLLDSHEELYDFQYLPDLAIFEWEWHRSYYATNSEPFKFAFLEHADPGQYESIYFQLNTSLSFQRTVYPVIDLWKANHEQPFEEQYFYTPDNEVYYVISRMEYFPSVEIITKNEYEIFSAIENKDSLKVLVAKYEQNLQKYLPIWIKKEWVTGIFLKD